MQIQSVDAYQIFDSRGAPTVECRVFLNDGASGLGRVPSGASRGQHEAFELRDHDPSRFGGLSVFNAVANVNSEIAQVLKGRQVFDQALIDQALIELDGTEDKSRLGANAILAASMAVAAAAANSMRIPLYQYLSDDQGTLLPLPEVQIIGGGAHAQWRTDVQDFLLIAVGAGSYQQALEMTSEVYRAAGELLLRRGCRTGVADEGGYWPEFDANEAVLEFLVRAIDTAGFVPGNDCMIALDFAASDLFDGTHYRLALDRRRVTPAEFIEQVCDWCQRYPILSIEDPLADHDWQGWRTLTHRLTGQIQIVGDDLFTTNAQRIRMGIEQGAANAVLIKPNQIGTVSETIDAIRLTQGAGWLPVISARSGETEDAFIAHLAVAMNSGQIKVGSFARGERTVKWNELIRIERSLGGRARFEGKGIFTRLPGARPPSVSTTRSNPDDSTSR